MTGMELFGSMLDHLIDRVEAVQNRARDYIEDHQCVNCAGYGGVPLSSSSDQEAECDECHGTGRRR